MNKGILAVVIILAVTVIYQLGRLAERSNFQAFDGEVQAQESADSPRYRDHYYPGTEELAADEMRVTRHFDVGPAVQKR